MQLLNKLTMKAIDVSPYQTVTPKDANGKQEPVAAVFNDILLTKAAGTVPVARVFGRATSCKSKVSDFGESFEFKGNFEATRLSDGEVFRSAKLYLPKLLEGLMADALANSDDALDFVVEIGVKASGNAHHYEWTVKPLMDNQAADPLAHLRAAVAKDMPALTHEETQQEEKVVDKPAKRK